VICGHPAGSAETECCCLRFLGEVVAGYIRFTLAHCGSVVDVHGFSAVCTKILAG